MSILTAIITSSIEAAYAILTLIATRWLLFLSTPEDDIKWLKAQGWYKFFAGLKWYRGLEWYHQMKAREVFGL